MMGAPNDARVTSYDDHGTAGLRANPAPELFTRAAERHRRTAGRFAVVARQVTRWEAPSPVAGWTAHDVPAHLITWFTAFLAAGGVGLPAPIADVRSDPVAAWTGHCAAVQALFNEGDRRFVHPYTGEDSLAEAIDKFYTADVFMHTWDLARSAGINPQLDPGRCAELLEGMQPIEAMLRSSGQYGPSVEVDIHAPAQDRLMAFIGRDPRWTPPIA
jgi:uncharacterized protein (TIGR03086 family)